MADSVRRKPRGRRRAVRPPRKPDFGEASPSLRSPGRSLPRWLRRLRAVAWTRSRPFVRRARKFHRRTPAVALALLYLGALATVSLLVIVFFFTGSTPPPPAPVVIFAEPKKFTLQPETGSAAAEQDFPLRIDAEPAKAVIRNSLSLAPDETGTNEQMADVEFRAGRFSEAEYLYRKTFLESADKAFAGFRIYVCAIRRDRRDLADNLLPRLDTIAGETPAPLYARAFLAFEEGHRAAAEEILAEARTRFGPQCAAYDSTLRILGLEGPR